MAKFIGRASRLPSCDLLHLERQMLEIELAQIEVLGRLVDVQTHGPPLLIHIEDDSLADFDGVGSRSVGKITQ